MNPNWFTKPKYMLNSQYCEQDGDCIKGGKTCSPFNKFAVNKNYDCDSSGIVFCNPSSSCDIVYLRAEDE